MVSTCSNNYQLKCKHLHIGYVLACVPYPKTVYPKPFKHVLAPLAGPNKSLNNSLLGP